MAQEKFAAHNRAADIAEPHLHEGKVRILPDVKQALDAYADSGFTAMLADEADGGLQLPYSVALLSDAMFLSANVSSAGYFLLARGVANLLGVHGSPEQQRLYRQPIIEGRFLGTMCLSEPQAGSSLGDISTRAEPAADGSYRLVGQKMWISGGEHELAENIIHLVLAKIPGGPLGVKGISLFVVPRLHVNNDGSTGAHNDVRLAGINHKLGQRGIVNTFLKFGEAGECVGHLVGAPHQGLAQMFHMMNEARIGVGMGAIMLGLAGYDYSLGYARERRQGRHPDQKDPASPPVALVEHADIKRLLLQQRSYCEGALALALHAGQLIDARDHHPDSNERLAAAQRLELLTPVLKAWSAEYCTRANDAAIQVLGGYGYTREYPVEQLWRDNRLNPIHEGSNGIQGMDLLGRKVLLAGGEPLRALLAELDRDAMAACETPELAEFGRSLQAAIALLGQTTQVLVARLASTDARLALANASLYLTLFGHVLVAWIWLRQARLALAAGASAAPGEQDFYRGKLATCQYFFRYELPSVLSQAHLLQTLDDTTLAVSSEQL